MPHSPSGSEPVGVPSWDARHHLVLCPGAGGADSTFQERYDHTVARVERRERDPAPAHGPQPWGFTEAGLWDGAVEPVVHGFLDPALPFAPARAWAVDTAAALGSPQAVLFAHRAAEPGEPHAPLAACVLRPGGWDPITYGRFLRFAERSGAWGAGPAWRDANALWLLDLTGADSDGARARRLLGAFGEATGLIGDHELFLLRVPAWVGVARESLARARPGADRAQVPH